MIELKNNNNVFKKGQKKSYQFLQQMPGIQFYRSTHNYGVLQAMDQLLDSTHEISQNWLGGSGICSLGETLDSRRSETLRTVDLYVQN